MNINQQKLKEYGKELWYWKGKSIPLIKLDIAQLEHCKRVINSISPDKLNTQLYNRNIDYWYKAINYIIKYKSDNNLTKIEDLIVNRRLAKSEYKVNNIYNMFKSNTIIGNIKQFEIKNKNN